MNNCSASSSEGDLNGHPGPRTSRRRRLWPHVLGLTWVVASALVVLAPALHHGWSLGPYDLLSQSGLTRAPGTTVRSTATGDQIAEMVPWSTLAWTQIHHGHLPLWNPYSGLGLPLAFNWQSGVFGLPALLSYAFPLHLVYTVQVITTLIVAGSGVYVLSRVLGVGVIGCAFAGTMYELSGSFMGWMGYPHAAVMSWAGWLLAMAILITRGRHRARYIAAFAVFLALAVFAGQPEILAMLVISTFVIVLIIAILRARAARQSRRLLRPVVDLVLAVVAGIALGAPLVLPGIQVLSRSTRTNVSLLAKTEAGKALPPHDLFHILVQGYNGLPIAGSHVFGDAVYFDTAAYLGTIGICLALLGVVRAWRRHAVIAFSVLAVLTAAIIFAPPVNALLIRLPLIQTIDWHRELMMFGLCIAILAGIGLDAVVRHSANKSIHHQFGIMLACAFVVLLIVRFVGYGGLTDIETGLRRASLLWPLITTALAIAVVVLLGLWTRRATASRFTRPHGEPNASDPIDGAQSAGTQRGPERQTSVVRVGRMAGGLLLLLETAFLIASGAQLWSSSPRGVVPSPTVASLHRSIGDSSVGFGSFTCFAGPAVSELGILPESNILFGVHEFDFYDPILPRDYFKSWSRVSSSTAGVPIYNSFCPDLTTSVQARRFGVEFVLVTKGSPGPKGAVFDRTIGDEDLYRIPGSGEATLTAESPTGVLPPTGAGGTPVAVAHPSPSSWRIVTTSHSDSALRLRLTNEPGWHATIDGRPLPLYPYADLMFQAHVPAGTHVITLHYWPPRFTVGLIVSGCCAVVLVASLLFARARRRSAQSVP